jgi:hypothetical protein
MRRPADWRHNLGLKVLSVALALLLWSFVHGAKVVERELVLPLRCTNLADSLALLSEPPREARVQVSGATQEFVLRRLLPGAELRVNLTHARPPLVRVTPTVTEVAMGGTTRLTVVRILEPSVIDLGIDRRAERTLPVRVVLKGAPAAGWAVDGVPRAEPAEVRCSGAASRIAPLRHVSTVPLDLDGKSGAIDTRVALAPPATAVTLQPPEVRVHVLLQRVGALQTGAALVPAMPDTAAAVAAAPAATPPASLVSRRRAPL